MYAEHFQGLLTGFADALVARPPAASIVLDGDRLREPAHIDALMARYAESAGCHERRATASQWSKYFFSRLGIAVVVVQLATDRALDVDLGRLRIAFDADGLPQHFSGMAPRGAPGDDFDSLLDGAFAPVIDTLHERSGLAPRIFASNASIYFEWALGQLRAQGRVPAPRLARAEALMEAPQRGGRRNILHAPYKRVSPGARDGEGEPVSHCRRLCCVRDLDVQWGLCANCPRAITFERTATRAHG